MFVTVRPIQPGHHTLLQAQPFKGNTFDQRAAGPAEVVVHLNEQVNARQPMPGQNQLATEQQRNTDDGCVQR